MLQILRRRHNFSALAFLLPAILLLLLLGAFPMGYSIYLSFTNTILSKRPPYSFVGLQNYVALFQDRLFLNSLWKTLYFSILLIFGLLFFGTTVAFLLNQNFRAKGVVLATVLIPWAIPKVVNALIWKWVFDGNFGIFNVILKQMGIIKEFKFWFIESPMLGLALMAMASIWKEMPLVAILILAALQTVPRELYEAATIDGAGALARLFYVTLPNIRPALAVALILTTISSVKTFDLVAVLTQGGPGDQTMLTYYYAYILGFNYLNIGRAAAVAYLISVGLVILTIVYYVTVYKRET